MLPVIILAGGLATRLRPLTTKIPKALVPVQGKPFIFWQLQYLYAQGIRDVVICAGFLGEQIQAAVGNGSQFGLTIKFSFDGPNLLQTGGAIKKSLNLVDEHFFILYGDSFLPINFSEIQTAYFQHQKPALVTILKNTNQWDKSNVLYRNNRLVEYNKEAPSTEMKYIDYGLSILSQQVFTEYPENVAFDLSRTYHKLSLANQLYGHEVFTRFYEIGSFQGLKEAELFLSKNEKEFIC